MYGDYGSYGNSYGSGMMYGSNGYQQALSQVPNQLNNQQNERKKVFEQYFKMMGGMRSILELGFAGVAFYNFGSKAFELVKKIFMFLLSISKRFADFIVKIIPIENFKKVLVVTTGSKNSLKGKNLIISLVRIGLVLILALSYKLRNSMKKQILQKHKQLTNKVEQLEQKQEEINKKLEKYIEGSNL